MLVVCYSIIIGDDLLNRWILHVAYNYFAVVMSELPEYSAEEVAKVLFLLLYKFHH